MRVIEPLLIILAMIFPFVGIKSHDLSTYIYWTAVVSLYLAYTTYKRWEIE